jgi:DNA topoisomerase-1
MMVAQKLYEQGFITYMRTDSTNLSKEALAASKQFILDKFGKDFLPDSSNVYKSKVANAQEAHEAIRPAGTTFQEPAQILSSVGSDEGKLYGLILNRTLASQMKPAQYIRTNIALKNGKSMYKASGNITTFKGYTAVYEQALSRNQKAIVTALPPIENDSKILHTNIDTLEKNTTPPRRFSEAMLVKEMEARGIGRPSTYSAILDKLVKKEYVVKQNKALIPTFVGIAVTQLLENHYLSLFNEKFTAGMEQQLDAISRSENTYLGVLEEFYNGKEDYAGVAKLLEAEIDIAKACTVNISEKTNIRIGKFGPYVEKDGTNITIPQDLFLGDLNQERIDKLSSMQKEDNIIGKFNDGENILLKVGRYGPYVELQESKKRASIPKGTANEDITEKMASDLLSLPKTLGKHPDTEEDILATFGPYGPYVKCGKINASMKSTDSPLTISLEDAVKLIKDRKLKFEPTILGIDPKTKYW